MLELYEVLFSRSVSFVFFEATEQSTAVIETLIVWFKRVAFQHNSEIEIQFESSIVEICDPKLVTRLTFSETKTPQSFIQDNIMMQKIIYFQNLFELSVNVKFLIDG